MLTCIITTFLRDSTLLENFRKSVDNVPNIRYIIVDQAWSSKKLEMLTVIAKETPLVYLGANFDCGLSTSRNIGVNAVKTDYTLISADSIVLTKIPDLSTLSSGIYGLGLKGFTWSKKIVNGRLVDVVSQKAIVSCDIVPNFFIAKTDTLKEHSWSNELKLCEHRDFFLKLKNASVPVTFDNRIYGYKHVEEVDNNSEYMKYRAREWNTYKTVAESKWGKEWIG